MGFLVYLLIFLTFFGASAQQPPFSSAQREQEISLCEVDMTGFPLTLTESQADEILGEYTPYMDDNVAMSGPGPMIKRGLDYLLVHRQISASQASFNMMTFLKRIKIHAARDTDFGSFAFVEIKGDDGSFLLSGGGGPAIVFRPAILKKGEEKIEVIEVYRGTIMKSSYRNEKPFVWPQENSYTDGKIAKIGEISVYKP